MKNPQLRRSRKPGSILSESARLRALTKKHVELSLESENEGLPKSDLAFRVLETLIVSMDLKPGDSYTVEFLCDLLVLGRSPVRDALKRLEGDGLVTLQRGTGVLINSLKNDDLGQLLVVRRALELVATQEAIRNGSQRQKELLAYLGGELEEAATANDLKRFMHIGLIAYRKLCESTDNQFVAKPLMAAYSLSRRLYFSRITEPRHVLEAAKLHRVRFQAIAESALEVGRDATNRLMDFFQSFVSLDQAKSPAVRSLPELIPGDGRAVAASEAAVATGSSASGREDAIVGIG